MAIRTALRLKWSSTVFLQCVIVLIGIAALAFLLWEPHVEGRNRHATMFEVYFQDPFLAFVYVGAIPFFVALCHGFTVLGQAGRNQVFSPAAVKSLRTIKRCAIVVIGLVAIGEIYIMTADSDDRAGGVFMGLLVTVSSLAVANAAATLERILQAAVDLKSANDLTV